MAKQIFNIFPVFLRLSRDLAPKAALCPGDPALFGTALHQNDVRADPLDAIPGDHKIVLAAPEAQKTAGAGDNDGEDFTFRKLDAGVADISQPPPITNTDDLFAVQIRKFGTHAQPSYSHICSRICTESRNMTAN